MVRLIWQRYGLLGLLVLALFKLWVVHTEEIYGSSTEYDALWYVGSAKHWYWGAPYSWTAFIRPCAYPLFISLSVWPGLLWLRFPLIVCRFRRIGLFDPLVATLILLGTAIASRLIFFPFSMQPGGWQAMNATSSRSCR
jgi:hypothetical protein